MLHNCLVFFVFFSSPKLYLLNVSSYHSGAWLVAWKGGKKRFLFLCSLLQMSFSVLIFSVYLRIPITFNLYLRCGTVFCVWSFFLSILIYCFFYFHLYLRLTSLWSFKKYFIFYWKLPFHGNYLITFQVWNSLR